MVCVMGAGFQEGQDREQNRVKTAMAGSRRQGAEVGKEERREERRKGSRMEEAKGSGCFRTQGNTYSTHNKPAPHCLEGAH